MTLVEAVLGSVVLGTLLVSILLARVQMEGQSRLAAQREAACGVLDELMSQWWSEPATLPLNESGPVEHRKGWRWKTRAQDRAEAAALGGRIVIVEVFAPGQRDLKPAASIELLMPLPVKDEQTNEKP